MFAVFLVSLAQRKRDRFDRERPLVETIGLRYAGPVHCKQNVTLKENNVVHHMMRGLFAMLVHREKHDKDRQTHGRSCKWIHRFAESGRHM